MTECSNCGATTDEDAGIIVGPVANQGWTACTICRADELREETVLSKREAEVAAHKQISGATHETIAERLDINKSTVDEYSRRMKDKVEKSRVTQNELNEFL